MSDAKDNQIAIETEPTAASHAWAEEKDRLLEEKAELEDLLRRRQAEFENFRKRAERERAETYEDATAATMAKLLPVVDDFERAMKSAPAAEGLLADYVKGMALIHQQFVETLVKLGLKPLDTAGAEFDPNLHHAVQKVEVEGTETDMVMEEYQRGYLFKERLVRPAMVKVAVKG
jgi:molecular chaperone GrpE